MNCQKGDVAIVVKSAAGHEGKIVRCLRFVGAVPGWIGEDRWEIDQNLPGWCGTPGKTFRDSWLRPIRDPGDDAVDETLLRIPSPRQEVTACSE